MEDHLTHRPPPLVIAALRDARALLELSRRTRDVRHIELAIDLICIVLEELEAGGRRGEDGGALPRPD